MSATITRMPLEQILSLRSTDSDCYCVTCGNSIWLGVCECPDALAIEMERGVPVALLVAGKRHNDGYTDLVAKLAAEGQITPLRLCFTGSCLLNGHHRVAAALELGWDLMDVLQDATCAGYDEDDCLCF